MEKFKELYSKLEHYGYNWPWTYELKLLEKEIIALRDLTMDDTKEIESQEEPLATLLLRCISIEDFTNIMIYMQDNLLIEVFHVLIDYEGNAIDGKNPVDMFYNRVEGTTEERLVKTFEFIEIFYDSKFRMVYDLYSYEDYPTIAHYIMAHEDDGKQVIIDALDNFYNTSENFNLEVLDSIEDEYASETNSELDNESDLDE